LFVPRLSLPMGLSGELMTHDPARARVYDDDPLVFGKATARWFTELEKAQARTLALAGEIAMPLYVLFGGADPVVKRSGVRAFFEAAGCEDKTFDERPGLYHEPLSEPEWKDVTESVAKWMLARA
jgi:alpha-beta hydrolase superfamily lysophospholipase